MPRRSTSTRQKTTSANQSQVKSEPTNAEVSENAPSSMMVKLKAIVVPEQQIRRYFDPEKMAQLTASVKEHGILENLLVRPLPKRKGFYQLVAGERRYRAAKEAKLTEVPVTVKDLTDEEALAISLVENLQRDDLNPVEETEGIILFLSHRLKSSEAEVSSLLYKLNNETKKNLNHNVMVKSEIETIEQIFREIGLMSWQSFVSNRLPLLKLPEDLLESLRKGKIAYTKAKAIAKIFDAEAREKLLDEAIECSLSLTQIQERVADILPKKEKYDLRNRFDATYKQVRKAKDIWQDPQKQKKLKSLLKQLEKLMEASE